MQRRDEEIEARFTATRPHPGAIDVVRLFHGLGLPIAIATSRYRHYVIFSYYRACPLLRPCTVVCAIVRMRATVCQCVSVCACVSECVSECVSKLDVSLLSSSVCFVLSVVGMRP